MTSPRPSNFSTQPTGEHRLVVVASTEEVGFVRAMRAATSDDLAIRTPSNIPDNERWIWENPRIGGEILKGSDEMPRGNIVRRVICSDQRRYPLSLAIARTPMT